MQASFEHQLLDISVGGICKIVDNDEEDGNSVKASRDPDKIDPWGDNPDWDAHWVKAHKINYLGRVSRD